MTCSVYLTNARPGYGTKTTAITDMVDVASPAPALVISVGVLLAAYKGATSVQSWRTVSDWTARYLRFIESAGYELSDVELRACGAAPESFDVDA
jgi:ParB family chromosome partitioning protein